LAEFFAAASISPVIEQVFVHFLVVAIGIVAFGTAVVTVVHVAGALIAARNHRR
jgi:hypothetical protein